VIRSRTNHESSGLNCIDLSGDDSVERVLARATVLLLRLKVGLENVRRDIDQDKDQYRLVELYSRRRGSLKLKRWKGERDEIARRKLKEGLERTR